MTDEESEKVAGMGDKLIPEEYSVEDIQQTILQQGILKVNKYGRIVKTRTLDSIANFSIANLLNSVKNAPKNFKRDLDRIGPVGLLTRFPWMTIFVFLLITSFFVWHSGFLDSMKDENSLKVNGDLEVYLPEGKQVADDINEVREDWTTNVMIIYVESNEINVTSVEILHEIDALEKTLNKNLSDNGITDDYIYVLSLSTVIKEINSSAPRAISAFSTEIGNVMKDLGGQDDIINEAVGYFNDRVDDAGPIMGEYSIPSQTTVDQIITEMYEEDEQGKKQPTPGLNKLAKDTDGDGELDRAVIIVGVVESKDASELIENAKIIIADLAKNNSWNSEESSCDEGTGAENECLDLKMTLTGPVPITNAVTEFSFKLFWEIFPYGCIYVALGLFIFHSDLLQTGTVRPLQGLKIVIISGLPTLCSVFCTLGILGATNYEVTMTVIIVGPILLALGVSYGLHITNRYAEETGTPDEKMKKALQSTGKAVLLSAITTVIGFISLVFTPMAPIKTVGIALSLGIVVVYIMTMAMVPNLTMILDLKKPAHPPLKIFDKAVSVPIKWPAAVIAVFMVLLVASATWGYTTVEENIDLLGMAPEDEEAVKKMKQYSTEFDAGQVGMILVKDTNVSGDLNDDDPENDNPFANLENIEILTQKANLLPQTTAVSSVFLMKSVGINIQISGTSVWEIINESNLFPQPIKDVAEVVLDRNLEEKGTFWDVLQILDAQGNDPAVIFLLDVFYASITNETRQFFISEDFKRSLIYVDMPFIPISETQETVQDINEYANNANDIQASGLIGVAAISIEVNNEIVGSQWWSLFFAVSFTLITLGMVFRDLRYAIWTTLPVVATVGLQWLVMAWQNVDLSLVTVMIGSILVGVGVDFSIHISNRIREMGGSIEAIRTACVSTGMSLFEAATVTTLGLIAAYLIPIPSIKPFVTVVILLLWIAAASALILLPAIFSILHKLGIPATGGSSAMARSLGLLENDAQASLIGSKISGKINSIYNKNRIHDEDAW